MTHYTRHSLKKIESFLEELGLHVRYEKGQFKSGYCIVESSSMIIVNKFLDVTSRVQILMEILSQIDLSVEELNLEQNKVYKQLFKQFYEKVDDKLSDQ